MTILIIEDEAPIRDMLVEVLEEEGYPVRSVSNGQEGLALLRSAAEQVQLILLDLMMPVMDGWAFRQAQLRDPKLMGIPVVILSAAYELHRQAAAMNVASFLQKPVELTKLLTTVAKFHP